MNVVRFAFQTMVGIGTLLALLGLVYLAAWLRRRRLPDVAVVLPGGGAAGPLSVVALIAGWITTEVGRQPWVVYGVMRTSEAVTGAGGIPVGYATLALVYVGLAVAVVWLLRRFEPGAAGPRGRWREAARSLADVPIVFILVGLAAYAVLAGADFGAGFWKLSAAGGERARRRASTPSTRWARSGRPTTSG